jgi:hypothetical protein
MHLGLMYGQKGSRELEVSCDADFAGDLDRRGSCTGYIAMMYGGAVSWQSRLQCAVAVSTCEAEYQAASAVAGAVKCVCG